MPPTSRRRWRRPSRWSCLGDVMGASKAKAVRFFAKHPFCCFCGGKVAATTIDHVPNRACFLGRAFPDDFEFPACNDCQNASRKNEMAFSFAVQMMEHDPANQDPGSWQKAIAGLANNFREALPNPYIAGAEKRKGLARLGHGRPPGVFSKDLPVATVPKALNEAILAYAKKITVAMFYKEKQRPPERNYLVWTIWSQAVDLTMESFFTSLAEKTPIVKFGKRSNMNIGNRLIYRCNYADDPDILLLGMQFGLSIIVTSLIVEPKARIELGQPTGGWTEVGDIFLPFA